MFRSFAQAFMVPELRNKILFTLFILMIYRFGSVIPIPGVDYKVLNQLLTSGQEQGLATLIGMFSGGALSRLALFALGIMPYITASIVLQLLVAVIPKLEEWQKEGPTGQAKITQITRYVTIALALLQSAGTLVLIETGQLFGSGLDTAALLPDKSLPMRLLMMLTLTAGTAIIMWLGELITDHGIGNGMSILIFAAIIAALPAQYASLYESNTPVFWAFMAISVVLIVGVVYVEQGQRRIPVQYAKRQVGRRTYGGGTTYLPLKVNQSGVIPLIFASSLLYLPVLAGSIVPNEEFQKFVAQYFTGGTHPVYIVVFAILTVFFCFFYAAITFNPEDVADNMKKSGGYIPGIRPGRPTAEYLDYVLTRITTAGAGYLTILAVMPLIVLATRNIYFPMGGSTLLIVVGVALQTLKELEAQLMERHYEGFIRTNPRN